MKQELVCSSLAASMLALLPNAAVSQDCCVDTQQPSLTPSASTANSYDQYGKSLALFGDILAVGEHSKDLDSFTHDTGEVQMFAWNSAQSTWTFVQTLESDSPSSGALFGHDVDIDGDFLIVGSNGREVQGQASAGLAEVFKLDPTSGLFGSPEELRPDEYQSIPGWPGEEFGHSVAIDGNWAIVTSHKYAREPIGNSPTRVGRAYVFEFDEEDEQWSQVSVIDPPTEIALQGREFGWSVAMDGIYAVIGAPGDPNEGQPSDLNGIAFVFRRGVDGIYVQEGDALQDVSVPGSFANRFGKSVDIEGSTVVVGCPESDLAGSTPNNGAAFVFKRDLTDPNDPQWIQDGPALLPCDPGRQLRMGWSVSISHGLIALGARERKSPQLATAHVFRRNANLDWELTSSVDGYEGNGNITSFGWDVAISSDRLVVSDPQFNPTGNPADQELGAIFTLARAYSTRPSCNCPADLDLDLEVEMDDIGLLLSNWGTCLVCWGTDCEPCPGDLDGNGTIDETDLQAMFDSFGACGCDPASTCTPAPQSLQDCFNQYTQCPRLCDCIEAIIQLGNGS